MRFGFMLRGIIPFFILWTIWLKMNEKEFSGKELSWEGFLTIVFLRISTWASVKKECTTLKIDNLLPNWEACLKW